MPDTGTRAVKNKSSGKKPTKSNASNFLPDPVADEEASQLSSVSLHTAMVKQMSCTLKIGD